MHYNSQTLSFLNISSLLTIGVVRIHAGVHMRQGHQLTPHCNALQCIMLGSTVRNAPRYTPQQDAQESGVSGIIKTYGSYLHHDQPCTVLDDR